mmetsp:Transcript_73579/g.238120  ORF Transcript_73579/g.238120 Transcript_73579/m.238120 type:complete len:205 (+) Transcript_73579:192-806(+)
MAGQHLFFRLRGRPHRSTASGASPCARRVRPLTRARVSLGTSQPLTNEGHDSAESGSEAHRSKAMIQHDMHGRPVLCPRCARCLIFAWDASLPARRRSPPHLPRMSCRRRRRRRRLPRGSPRPPPHRTHRLLASPPQLPWRHHHLASPPLSRPPTASPARPPAARVRHPCAAWRGPGGPRRGCLRSRPSQSPPSRRPTSRGWPE